MIVRGGDRVDMLMVKSGVSKSDKLVFIVQIRRHSRSLLTTNNGCVGLDIGPDSVIDVIICMKDTHSSYVYQSDDRDNYYTGFWNFVSEIV